jgi:hypothetical protein
MKSVIAFDADGVIFNFILMFSKVYEKLYKEKFIIYPNRGSISGQFEDISNAPIDRVIKVVDYCISSEAIDNTPFIPRAVEVLNKMFKNYQLPIITKRPKETHTKLLDYFHKNLPNVADIEIFCTEDAIDSKIEVLNKIGCSYFVDDRLETCCSFWKKGIHAILFECVTNQIFLNRVQKEYPFYPNIFRNWDEVEIFLKTIM